LSWRSGERTPKRAGKCDDCEIRSLQPKKLEKMGLRAKRLQLERISAAEGLRFKEVIEKMEQLRQSGTEQEVAETKQILKNRSAVPDPE
jgi:coenzyme F420-reducing hydrogenase delta subunit